MNLLLLLILLKDLLPFFLNKDLIYNYIFIL